MPAQRDAPTSSWLGVLFLVAGLWTLTLQDTAGKLLSMSGYHVVMIAWMRYSLNTVLMTLTLAPLYRRRTGRSILQSARPQLQIARALLMLVCTLLVISLIKIVPLAEAAAMTFCAPLIVLVVSPWLLGERTYASRWVAAAVGFTGMLIVMRPGGALPAHGVALGLMSAVAFAFFLMLSRKANQNDDPLVTLYYGGLTGMVASSVLVPFFWSQQSPAISDCLLLASIGITSTLGHFLLNSAYRYTEASALSPFTYSQIIAATTVGWLVFGQFPEPYTLFGIAVICASGVSIALIEHRRTRPPAGRT